MDYPFAGAYPSAYTSSFEHVRDIAVFFSWTIEMCKHPSSEIDIWKDNFYSGFDFISARENLTQKEGHIELRIFKLNVDFNLFEKICLGLAIAAELFKSAEMSFKGETGNSFPEYRISVFLTSLIADNSISLTAQAFNPNSPVKEILETISDSTPILSSCFSLKEYVILYLIEAIDFNEYQKLKLASNVNMSAHYLQPLFSLDDIVISEDNRKLLNRICYTAKLLPEMFEKYGYQKLFPYGRCIGVLFHGPPGTGKTMAVHTIANELELGILSVDLSMIIDKYIGETEKKLSEIFELASSKKCILFFDEADSLFAKRTEVKDAHDRYANVQTAYLLQKMESFDGIVIVATNLFKNIDNAFKRRFPFIVGFSRPNAAMRLELWRKFIPDSMPKDDLDYELLAETFDLTPAAIKWTSLSAGVTAVYNDKPLSMEHILDALRYEYEKTGVAFPENESNRVVL